MHDDAQKQVFNDYHGTPSHYAVRASPQARSPRVGAERSFRGGKAWMLALAADEPGLNAPPHPAAGSSFTAVDRCAHPCHLHVRSPGYPPHAVLRLPCAPNLTQSVSSADHRSFKIEEKIGEGTYGVVYRARDSAVPPLSPTPAHYSGPKRYDKGMVALKKMRLDAHDEGVPVTTLREVALLQDLRHDNIVRLREVSGREVGTTPSRFVACPALLHACILYPSLRAIHSLSPPSAIAWHGFRSSRSRRGSSWSLITWTTT